ncbi:MAG: LPS-assembly protein LptD [Alphaproteobacteria bacterium]|nr:LPS-assembly protein LptD [Alphaproteobacteria bacterium]
MDNEPIATPARGPFGGGFMNRFDFQRTAVQVRSLACCALALGIWAAVTPAVAQVGLGRQSFRSAGTENQPVLLTADEVSYDRDLQIVTARGHVEVTSGDRLIRADVVSYNEATKMVTASGNITLMEPTGDVLFGNYMEFTDDLKNGVIQNLRAILQDRSRLAAVSGRRADGNITVGRDAVYSPCELCRDDPTAPPLWQMKAAQIEHDQDEKQVSYRDAWMEIGGVPILYTPYLEHPDGTQGRKSGFLSPGYSASTTTGTRIPVPYYQVLSEQSDITYIPIFIPNDNPVLAADYRRRSTDGYMEVSGSFVKPETHNTFVDPNNVTQTYDWRGHIKGDAQFDIDNEDRWGFNAARASDRYYLDNYSLLSRFQFANYNALTSRLYGERFYGSTSSSYLVANAYSFQGLLPSDNAAEAPNVLPSIDSHYVGDKGPYGEYYTFDASTLNVLRRTGTETQRVTAKPGWHVPYISDSGQVYSLDATVQTDVWHATGINLAPDDPFNPTEDGYTKRFFPQLSLGSRYPFINRGTAYNITLEPIATVDIAPNMGSQARFPNEDSRGVSFDTTNLFSANRFPGYDRVDGGQRVNYGVNTSINRLRGGLVEVFAGQSYSLQHNEAMPPGSGLDQERSSYVARIRVSPHSWLTSRMEGQFDPNFGTQVVNASVTAGPPNAATVSAGYLYIKAATEPGVLVNDVKQLSTIMDLRLTPHWRFEAFDAYDLGIRRGQLLQDVALVYEDECLILEADVQRIYIGSVNNPNQTIFSFRVVFRNLGEIDAGTTVGGTQ